MDVLVRVPHLQQKENSTKFINQIALNNKFDFRFSSPLLKLFKIISSETPIPTLLEAVQEKKTKLPYKKGTYQQGHSETHITICLSKGVVIRTTSSSSIFLKKVRQKIVSTTYIFEKLNLKIILANFNNFEVSKVLIREISDFIIFKKSETFSLPVCVSCLTFLACWLNAIICVSNLLTQLFRINRQLGYDDSHRDIRLIYPLNVGVGFLD